MSNGSRVLENFKADFDAPVVERILEAGGDIVGKTNCEYFCLSGGSATSYFGTVDNPRKKNFSTEYTTITTDKSEKKQFTTAKI